MANILDSWEMTKILADNWESSTPIDQDRASFSAWRIMITMISNYATDLVTV